MARVRYKPQGFKGREKNKKYFEGWYYKLVDKKDLNSFAFIPGIAYDSDGDGHAFIQTLDSLGHKTNYYKFPISSFFNYSDEILNIGIGENRFAQNEIYIDLMDRDYPIKGNIKFVDIEVFPQKNSSSGIMGPFEILPFMKSYHQVVNMDHVLVGKLHINDRIVDFTGGRGYIEKHWGKSFPKWWVWMQTNTFKTKGASFMLGIAEIDLLIKPFIGFSSFLKVGANVYLFSNHSGAKLKQMKYMNEVIDIVIEDKKYRLLVMGRHKKSGTLKVPQNGSMNRTVNKSISSNLKISLIDKKSDQIIFEDFSKNSGFQIVGR